MTTNIKAAAGRDNQSLSLPARLGWVSFFNDFSSEVIQRAIPLFLITGLGVSPAFVGVVEGLAETVSIFLKAFSGWLSDQMPSRKPFVLFGYSCSLLSRAALLAAGVPLFLAASRIFDRTGKGLRTAPRDAMIADAAAQGMAGRAFGITRFLDTLGALSGLALAIAVGVGSQAMTAEAFRTVVLLALPPGVISIALIIFLVPAVKRTTTAKRYLSFRIPKAARGYLAVIGIFALGNSTDAFLVLRANELGFSFREILMMLFCFNACAAALAIPVGSLSDRFGRLPFLLAGWLTYALTYFAFANTTTGTGFFVALLVYGAFYGFTDGTEKALLADVLPSEERGAGYGALQLTLGIAALPASFLTGYLMTNFGSRVALQTCAGFSLAGTFALGLWWFSKRRTGIKF